MAEVVEGLNDCQYFSSKIGEMERKCCGGKITKYAVINCTKRGRVNSKNECKLNCPYYMRTDGIINKNRDNGNSENVKKRSITTLEKLVPEINNLKSEENNTSLPDNNSSESPKDISDVALTENTNQNISKEDSRKRGKDVRPIENLISREKGTVATNFWQQWSDEIASDKSLHPEHYDKKGRRKS